jgi:lantibiotic biosynthesis protein
MTATKQLALERLRTINHLLAGGAPLQHHGLFNGTLGLSYYYYHAGRVLQDDALLQQAEDMLAKVFEDMNENDGGLIGGTLGNGGAGLGFMANYLQQQGYIEFDTDEELAELDNYLADTAMEQLELVNTDPLHGATGILHYFATRRPTPAITMHINRLVEKLIQRAEVTEDGTWFPNTFWKGKDAPLEVNLSLSHGLSGILMTLANAWPFVANRPPLEHLIREGIRFIQGHECAVDMAEERASFFPGNYLIEKGRPAQTMERLAWCYGDLNQVLAHYRVGKLLGDESYIAFADRIGLASMRRRSMPGTFNEDSHFCHGTAGLAQFCRALYNERPLDAYWDAYEYWIAQTLQQVDTDFAANKFDKNPGGLLEGWAGVGIVLAEYSSETPMPWAKVFFL